jgi:hypothetical protein
MSGAEMGVVVGVVLEGTEYVPSIKKRWPFLEKIGFLILVLALIADWDFQSRINTQLTQDLISANAANLALEKKMHGFVHKNEGLGGVD